MALKKFGKLKLDDKFYEVVTLTYPSTFAEIRTRKVEVISAHPGRGTFHISSGSLSITTELENKTAWKIEHDNFVCFTDKEKALEYRIELLKTINSKLKKEKADLNVKIEKHLERLQNAELELLKTQLKKSKL